MRCRRPNFIRCASGSVYFGRVFFCKGRSERLGRPFLFLAGGLLRYLGAPEKWALWGGCDGVLMLRCRE
jgi:hypothetical protein